MAVQPNLPGKSGGSNTGQMSGDGGSEKFANPSKEYTTDVKGMSGLHNDIGEKSGFETDGYIDKKGTPYGEAAKFNLMPPGMDISNQVMSDQRNLPLKKLVEESYAGDGWEPSPRDIPE